MSLTGSLEDLPLTDIVQIIALSKRTGILEVTSEDRTVKGIIVFKQGQVVSAILSGKPCITVGQYLVQQGIIAPKQLKQALEIQRRQMSHRPLGQVLVQQGWVTREELEVAVKQQIYSVIYELLQIERGTFTFYLTEVIPYDEIRVNPIDLVLLEKGLSVHQVLLDAYRVQDEARRVAEAPPSEVVKEAKPQPEVEPLSTVELDHVAVLLVMPSPTLRMYLAETLQQCGAVVIQLAESSETDVVHRLTEWQRLAKTVAVVVDAEGQEEKRAWIERIHRHAPDVPILIIDPPPGMDTSPHRPGIFYFLHRLASPEATPPDRRRNATFLGQAILDHLTMLVRRPPAQPPTLGTEVIERLRQELGLDQSLPEESDQQRLQRVLAHLKQAIQELRSPSETPQISLLMLQFAAEFLDRGLLFLNTTEGIIGLGGFGETGDDESMPIKVRRIRIEQPFGDLTRVIQEGQTIRRTVLTLEPWMDAFIGMFGRFRPREYILIPILVQNQVVGFFYGDNAVSGRPLGDLTYLEIFFHQAGFAIENALLHRRLDQPDLL